MAKNKQTRSIVIPFQRKSRHEIDLRTHLDGPVILGQIATHLTAIGHLEQELADTVMQHSRTHIDEVTGDEVTTEWVSTTLDKETIAVYHTRMTARKLQIDTALKMLNKVMPDLKAVESLDDVANAADRALKAFAVAASEE